MKRVSVVTAVAFAGASLTPCFAGQDAAGAAVRSARRTEDPAAKERLVDQIMAEGEQRAGQEWDAPSKENLKRGLLGRPFAELAQAARGGQALEVLMGVNALGGALSDFVFTPIPPCRALDTRAGSGFQGAGDGPLAPGTPYAFAVNMCVPLSFAKAVSINFTAVNPAGTGNLRAWPWASTNPPQPSTAVLTYIAGFSISNGVVIPICNWQGTSGGCVFDIFVQTNASAAHLVADLYGYFSVPQRTALDCTTVDAFLPFGAGVGLTATATASCATGYTLTGGGAHSAAGTNSMIVNKLNLQASNSVVCLATNNQANAHTGFCQARCCRTPGHQ